MFILSLPTLSAKEVLAKAKASGHKTSESNVHRVRRLHGRKKAAAKRTSPAAPSSKLPQSKADFVRGLPSSTPVKKVIAMAKAAGLSVSQTYVYALRRSSKGGVGKAGRPRVVVAKSAQVITRKTKTTGVPSSVEDLLRAVAAELGLGHAVEILQRERAQVRAVLGS
jgi:hypothetical protein